MTEGNIGTFGVIVWPSYVGAVNVVGQEPMGDPTYHRGQISWDVMPDSGEIIGRAVVDVPAGEWGWMIYCKHPTEQGFVSAQKLNHPLALTAPGQITLDCITESDVRPMNPDPVLRD
jgi:hypothetical protein